MAMSKKGYAPLLTDELRESSKLMGQIQNVKSKNVYVFGDGTVADDEDSSLELTQMSQRGSQKSYRSTHSSQQNSDVIIKEIPLSKTDTLQSLSIRFRCPISEIKRINSLFNDQEFYACKTLKIPVRSHQQILQQELDQLAKERLTVTDDLVNTAPYRASDIVISSEVSDDEEVRTARPVVDMLEVHSDPDDMESITLLDRGWPERKANINDNNRKEKKKFNKIIAKKDNELREIMEKVQRSSDAIEEVTAVMRTPPSLLGPQPPQRNCSAFTPTFSCIIASVLSLIGLLGLVALVHYLTLPPDDEQTS